MLKYSISSRARWRATRREAPTPIAATAMFCSTDRLGKIRVPWNVRAMPARAIRSGGLPEIISSPIYTRPLLGASTPDITFIRVLLPDPFGPMRPSTSPRSSWMLTPSTAVS